MKKLKSMKKRDEKIESLLMEKWGYSAPILREGPKEDGDKQLLTELGPLAIPLAYWGYAAAAAAVIGVGLLVKGEMDTDADADEFDVDYGLVSQSLRPGATQLATPEEMAQRIDNFDFPQAQTGEPFTWEDAILGPGATEGQRRSLEKTLRTQLGEEGLKIVTALLDKHFEQREGYQSLEARGRAPVDPDILATAKFHHDRDESLSPEHNDALDADAAERERVRALMNDETVQTVDQEKLDDIMARIGSDEYLATVDQPDDFGDSYFGDSYFGDSSMLDLHRHYNDRAEEEYRQDQVAAEPPAAEPPAAEPPAAEDSGPVSREDLEAVGITYESRVPKSTKDIIREEINKYFSNRRKS